MKSYTTTKQVQHDYNTTTNNYNTTTTQLQHNYNTTTNNYNTTTKHIKTTIKQLEKN
jgi:hypothetical protein